MFSKKNISMTIEYRRKAHSTFCKPNIDYLILLAKAAPSRFIDFKWTLIRKEKYELHECFFLQHMKVDFSKQEYKIQKNNWESDVLSLNSESMGTTTNVDRQGWCAWMFWNGAPWQNQGRLLIEVFIQWAGPTCPFTTPTKRT